MAFHVSIYSQTTGKSLAFDGVNDYIDLGSDATFGTVSNFSGDFTFEAWVYNDGSDTWARVFDFGDSTNDYIIFTVNSGGTGECRFEYRTGGGTKYKLDGGVFPVGEWTHVACRLTASGEVSIVLKPESAPFAQTFSANGWPPISNIVGTTRNYLGKSQFNDPYFKGKMKEVRVWKEDRSASQLTEWRDCELSGTEPNLIAYYKLNEGIVGANNNAHDFHVQNFGLLTTSDGVLKNFALTGSASNWVGDSPSSFSEDPLERNVVEFSNRGDAFLLNNESNFDFESEYTVEYWLFPNFNWPTFQYPLFKTGANGSISYYSEHKNDQVVFGQRTSSGWQTWATATGLEYNKWTHITLTAKEENGGLTNKIYFDGILKATKFTAGMQIPQTNDKVKLGSVGWFKMANIRFWDRALKADEIAPNISTIYPVGTSDLISQYVQYDDYSAGLVDNIGNNTGVRTATPIFSGDPCFVQFTQEPQDAEVAFGETITLSADFKACNTSNYSYQWQHDGVGIENETSLTLSKTIVDANDLGEYQLIVTACGQSFPTRAAVIKDENEGKVLRFDGVDDYVSFDDAGSSTEYTIEVRVRFDEEPRNQNIIVNTDANEDLITSQLAVNDEGYFQLSTLTFSELTTATHPIRTLAHKWYNVEIHYDRNNLWIEVDDVAGPLVPLTPISDAKPIWYLGKAIAGYGAFHGEMDEVRIWKGQYSTIVDQAVIANNSDLTHYFQFNEGIAEADNTVPSEINTMVDPHNGTIATLHNFDLIGTESNWLGCDIYDESDIAISFVLNYQVTLGNLLSLSPFISEEDSTETYQWYKDGLPIPGANDKKYEKFTTLADEGTYQLEVNRFGECRSYSPPHEVFIKGTGEVLHFDGVNDYIKIQNTLYNVSHYNNDYTVECWIKFDDDVTNQNIVVASNDIDGPKVSHANQLFTDENGYLVHYTYNDSNTNTVVRSIYPVVANQWYHVAIRGSKGATMKLFVDGVLQGSKLINTNGFWLGQTNWYVGSEAKGYDGANTLFLNNFHGEMDELRIWRSNFSDALIASRKDSELSNIPFGPLDYYLKLNQGAANGDNAAGIAIDRIPNHYKVNENAPSVLDGAYYNFDFVGETSNFTDCSPITKPELEYDLSLNTGFGLSIGQPLEFDLHIETGDTAQLLFQWLLDDQIIPGATEPIYGVDNMTASDFGVYKIAIEDMCSPVFRDTIVADMSSSSNTCYTSFANPTNYPDSTSYNICNSAEGETNLCNSGQILGGYKTDFGYCGTDTRYEGDEVVFHIALTEPKVVDLTLRNLGSDVDMFLFGDDCDISNCLGSSLELGLNDEFIRQALPIGDYYVVIDEKEFFENLVGSDSLILDIQMYDNKCSFSQPIVCGDEVSGNTANGSNFIDGYDAFSGYSSTEQVYELVVTEPVTINATLSGLSSDLDLFLLDSMCIEDNLLIASRQLVNLDESISYGVQPGTYYIIVDGKEGASGTFDLSVSCANYFDASVDETDAYIDLNWSIDKKACVPQDTGIIVRLITTPNTILFEQEYTTAALTPDVITGTYRDIVGDDHSRMYVLRVYNRLSNKTLCNEVKTGSTLPFQQPEIISISQTDAPDSIQVTWRNHSQLSEEFRIYRDGVQLASLIEGYTEDSLITTYVDKHNIDNVNSLQQNGTYNYCIETYSNTLASAYTQVCSTGTTVDLNFEAKGDPLTNAHLTWADGMSFADGYIIRRNGIQLATVSSADMEYYDTDPLLGEVVEYELAVIRDGLEKIRVTDTTFLAPNGVASGAVISSNDNYPVQNVLVKLYRQNNAQGGSNLVQLDSVVTDFEGKFQFSGLAYGLSDDFLLTASKDGSDITPESISFELNSATPSVINLIFTDDADIIVTPFSLLDTFTVDVQTDEDLVVLDWDYTYLPSEVIHFIIKRNGELIYEGNDDGGKIVTYTDMTGVPGLNYTYAIDAYRYLGDDVESDMREASGTYPLLTPLSSVVHTLVGQEQFDAGTGASEMVDPRIMFDWSGDNHPSQNFEGYRIFRDNILVGEVSANSVESFSFITVPDVEANYKIRTFKKVNGTTYESAAYPENGLNITALPLIRPNLYDEVLAMPPSDRAIIIDLTEAGEPIEFYENGVFDSYRVQRKLQNTDDSTYVELETLNKQFIIGQASVQAKPLVWDAFGIPGANYTYKLSTVLELDGQTYTRDTIFDRTCPAIVGPSNIQKTEEIGKVGLTWTDNSVVLENASQLYTNYTGYELSRRDSTNNGDLEIIATLPASTKSYNDYISNPVFNLFADAFIPINYEYELVGYFDIDGVRHYSAPLNIYGAPLDGSDDEPLPTEFMASKDIPGHIKLCWEWTAAKPSTFNIYRGDSLIGAMPSTARAYYDYDAPEDPTVLYQISSVFNGNESQKVLAEGRMPSNMKIKGRITNFYSGAGMPNINVFYRNLENSGQGQVAEEYSGSAMTDAAGNYYFEDIPHTPGYQYQIKIFGNNVDFNSDPDFYTSATQDLFDITTEREYVYDFFEYSVPDSTESVSPIDAVTAIADADSMYVEVKWSPENANYDGFQIFRVNQLIGEVRAGEGFSFIDRGGFPGINYTYTVRAYKNEVTGRDYSQHVGATAVYPTILPVENMTVTAFADMNQMLVSWSHPLDNHDFYRIRRNGDLVAVVDAGEVLMWYDDTGIPGVVYQYEISVIKGANISVPVVVEKKFKGVGEAKNLAVEINNFEAACAGVLSNDNHVTVSWNYAPGAADGFEIYRDGELIAEIDSTVLAFGNLPLTVGDTLMSGNFAHFDDYEGHPGTEHTYHVLAYVDREGARYTSGVEELFLTASTTYPSIAEVSGLDVAQNNIFGSAEINFSYPSFIVNGFIILRDGVAIDTIVEIHEGSYVYQDFTGLPGASYTYAVQAFDRRDGAPYLGGIVCEETIVYPIVPTPQNFRASQGTYENHIQVDWDFSLDAFVDSFYLENVTLSELETFGQGKRKYIDVVNDFSDNVYEYRIRASRINLGQTIYSEWTELTEGWSSRQVDGSEDQTIENTILTSLNGTSTSIDGEWAVSGARGGIESIFIYRSVNGGWSLFQTIVSPDVKLDSEFGHAVAISGNTIIVGAPESGSNGVAYIYEFNGTTWDEIPQIINPGISGNFGWAVDIDGDDIIVGNPLNGSNDHGYIHWYERQPNGFWEANGAVAGNVQLNGADVKWFGYGVAIEDGFSAASWARPSANFSEVVSYVKDGNGNWNGNIYINGPNLYTYEFYTTDNIDYSDNVLIIGDRAWNSFRGRVKIVELENNVVVNSTEILGTELNAQFGYSVAVDKISSPIDDAIYAVVGSPFSDLGGGGNGKIDIYSNVSGSFQVLEEQINFDPDIGEQYGYSVAMSDEAWAVGVPRDNSLNNGSVQIKNHLEAPNVVNATDGISADFDPTETTISWEFDGNYDLLAGFNIYRDEEFLTYRDKATMTLINANLWSDSWNDNSGEAGLPYVYSVRSVNNLIPFESYGTSEEGYNRADGKIIGSVKTQQGLVPVPGVTITAQGLVDGEVYYYTTTTQPNGEYVLANVYYDPTESVLTQYEVQGEYLDHAIIPQTTELAYLNPLSDPTQGIVDFFDVTAYVIKGRVAQPNVACPLEGVKITPYVNGQIQSGMEAYTDENGNYSLVVNPFEEGLQELKLIIEDELTVDDVTTQYHFVPDADTVFTDFNGFPIITEVNFNDALTYDISLKVKNTCNDAISNGKWDVRVRTMDGCFDEIFATNSNGDLVVPLIPQNYVIKVVGVDVATSINQQALDYYANFPVSLNLLDLHQDSVETLTKVEIEDMSARQMTFHKAAQIEVGGFSEVICNTQTAILQQGSPYSLTFDVFENHNGSNCSVQEGIIEVTNPAAEDSDPVIISYNEITESFDEYTFVAGSPNQIFPHAYAITFDYKTVDGIFLGRKVEVAFVEGSVALPGTDILVDPAAGNDAVPYPLLVLRDPPGDGSSAYISAGQTISFDTEMSFEGGFEAKLYSEIDAQFFGQGTSIEASVASGYSTNESIELSNSVTTSSTVTTSSDPGNIGRSADIIVGTGMVMQFGYIREFKVAEDECSKVQVTTTYGISPNAATTTWNYQIGQIEEIIQGYINDSIRVEIGTLTIERFGEPLSQEDARTFISTKIRNWKQVLRYHDVETVPYYNLCTLNPFDAPSIINAQAIQIYQAQLRPFFGMMQNGVFVLHDEIVWDDQLITFYNVAAASIRNLLLGGPPAVWEFPYNGAEVDLTNPLDDFSQVDFESIANSQDISNYTANFGDPVKNITTGGNILIEESINNAQSGTTSMSSSIFLGTELDVAVTFGGSSEIVVGTFAGVGGGVTFATVEELFKTEVKVGAAIETKFDWSNSEATTIEESVEIGYSIFDDDDIDAFSFAVIQPVNNNSTAYFDFFGGHTSCPPEEGSVFVDDPAMGLLVTLPDGSEGTEPTQSLYNVPADEAATYTVRVDNLSPIASQPVREYRFFLVSSSNGNGAVVTLNGVSLNNSEYTDTFNVSDVQDLTLTIERGPTAYDYPDIQIGVEPLCGDGPVEYIYASAYFVNPCSPVTLVSPIEDWVINDDTTKLVITMQDHDPDNPFLVDATVQYRRVGQGSDWTDIPALELEKANFVIPDSLAANDAEYAEGQIPKYFFIWSIPTTEGAYPDGEYEVRTKMTCDNFTSTISNVISGRIARDGLNLLGNPEPADQIWTAGDPIQFEFNKDLDCALIDATFIDNNISVVNEATGLEVPFTINCFGNRLVFVSDNPMSDYDGQFLTMSVDNVPSLQGNISLAHSWTFRVVTQQLYWAAADTVKISLYQDDIQSLTLNLENSGTIDVSDLDLEAEYGPLGDWLSITNPITPPLFSVSPSGRAITVEVDASKPEGIYNETINVIGPGVLGNTPQVHIQLKVLVKPPNWIIDPSDFQTNMNVIANWKYTTDDPDMMSTDVTDLISVWVGNEIRGVAPITESGEFYASYLTVYGRPDDGLDTKLEFRIWDADLGVEYDGQPVDTVFYEPGSIRGTTANPEILSVDAEYDRARYIPLRQGWTGFSLPHTTVDMSVMHKLRTLGSVTDGDLIVTGDKFSQYSDSLGWFNFGASNLTSISSDEGYMIYLDDGPDTLRVTGIASLVDNIELKSGWNWLGFPFENAEEVNDVLNLNAANATGDDRIKVDFPLPGQQAKFANYDIVGDNWNDGDLDNMEPYNLYKLYSGNPNGAVLSWTPQNNAKDDNEESLARMSAVVDPDDPATWVMPDLADDAIMPVIAEVVVGGVAASDPADRVAFFENDTIRALGNIEYIDELMVYEVSMLAESVSGNYDIRYYDASEGTVSIATNQLAFDINGVGDIFDPYEIIFEVNPCDLMLIIGPTGSPFALDKTFEASQEIRVTGNLTIPDGVEIILSAPKVTIADELITGSGAQVIVRPDGCE